MNKRGQSIIEYALIAVLVILGVVVMGPYVLRSVGAHFKLWDEGVKDSFTETLNQAPVNDVPNIPLTCTSCRYIKGSCNSLFGGSGSCPPNQREYDLNCGADPIGCSGQPAFTCQDDPLCCSGLINVGCGTTPLGQAPPPNNCNYGYQIQAKECGSTSTATCTLDSSCPMPACLGVIPQGATACPGATSGLTQNWGISAVQEESSADCGTIPNCTYCNPAQKCQYVMGNPPIECIYNGSPFSGTYNGDFEGQCADWTNVGACSGARKGGESDAELPLTFACTNNYLTGWCQFQIAHNNQPQSYRGIDNPNTPCSPYGGTASDILCNGMTGPQTFYWENARSMSSCFDGTPSSCGSYLPIPVCGWPNTGFACYPSACSNDSFTINCDATGHLQNITLNNVSTPYPPAPMHGCNWSGAQMFYDFGPGDDMTWTCDTSKGQGVLTQVEFTEPAGACGAGPNSPLS